MAAKRCACNDSDPPGSARTPSWPGFALARIGRAREAIRPACARTIEPRRPMRVQRALIDRQSIVWPPTRSMLLTTSLSPIGSGASAPYRCKPLARCPGCQRRGRGALQRRSPYRRTLRVRPPGLDRLRIRIRIRGVLGVLVDRGLNIAAGIRAATRGHPRRDERSAVRRTLGVLSPMTRLGLYSASRRNDDAPAVLRAPRPRARRSRRRWASWRLLRRAPKRVTPARCTSRC